MANRWTWFGRLHARLYRATNGALGANLAGLPMLLLTTRGRRTGMPRTTPMPYLRRGDDLIIVGSNNGLDHDPAWWLNLQAEPIAELQIGRQRSRARARRATPQERACYWPDLLEFNPRYAVYARRTEREIPVVILEPLAADPVG